MFLFFLQLCMVAVLVLSQTWGNFGLRQTPIIKELLEPSEMWKGILPEGFVTHNGIPGIWNSQSIWFIGLWLVDLFAGIAKHMNENKCDLWVGAAGTHTLAMSDYLNPSLSSYI